LSRWFFISSIFHYIRKLLPWSLKDKIELQEGEPVMNKGGKGVFEPSSLYHVGMVVRSVDETAKYYEEAFGIGPFEIREVNFSDATFMGEKGGYRGKRGFAKLGDITLELMEHIEGKTIHDSFMKCKGEGLHHLGFEVKSLKESIEVAEKRGLKVTQGLTREDGSGFAYLDSDHIGGVVFEVIEKAPK
jgi:methylmalonyl-CoA/ethylmalonyl-CoA epimerase